MAVTKASAPGSSQPVLAAGLFQLSHQFCIFVGGNATGNSQQYASGAMGSHPRSVEEIKELQDSMLGFPGSLPSSPRLPARLCSNLWRLNVRPQDGLDTPLFFCRDATMNDSHWPSEERPRERLLAHGPEALSDPELLAIFLRTGTAGMPVMDLARHLIQEFSGLRGLMSASRRQFCQVHGLGTAKYAQVQAAMEMARRVMDEPLRQGDPLTSPADTRRFLTSRLGTYPHEVFAGLFLDNRHRVIRYRELFRGTIDGARSIPGKWSARHWKKTRRRSSLPTIILRGRRAQPGGCFPHPAPEGSPRPGRYQGS